MAFQYLLVLITMIILFFSPSIFNKFLSVFLELGVFLSFVSQLRKADTRRNEYDAKTGAHSHIGLFFLSTSLFIILSHISLYFWILWVSKSFSILYYVAVEAIIIYLLYYNIYFMERITWKRSSNYRKFLSTR